MIYLGFDWIRWVVKVLGGERGIRTPDTVTRMSDFESGAFNRALPSLRITADGMVTLLRIPAFLNLFNGERLAACAAKPAKLKQ